MDAGSIMATRTARLATLDSGRRQQECALIGK
jgi:hypothetical protein